jgi:hypothetical protein
VKNKGRQVKNSLIFPLIFSPTVFYFSAGVEHNFITGMGMGTFVNVTLMCLNIEKQKNVQ